ncbi:PleD family two-component system response regulator [Candidatus Eisenbacteria bacterium]|uniref:PleD family two-component system response regulator n=1 Tax=Eiseniibacteriota bacterium TaxID=2212470 RepID=A0ABV6YI17_UNCEI
MILAAESCANTREVLRGAVEVLGHGILEAHDTTEAMLAIQAHFPDIDLIVLDWHLEGNSGFDTLRWIKSDARFSNIPVMLFLPDEDAAHAIVAFQEGASECLTGTFTEQDLMTRMLECLRRAA